MEPFVEGIRLARASERLLAIAEPLQTTMVMIKKVIDIAPELGPEMVAMSERVSEMIEHIEAAFKVVSAKIEMIDG